jgi:hypothetical protein
LFDATYSNLQTNRYLCWWERIRVLAGSVIDTGNGKCTEEDEEYLGKINSMLLNVMPSVKEAYPSSNSRPII